MISTLLALAAPLVVILGAYGSENPPPTSDTPTAQANYVRSRVPLFKADFEQFKDGRLDGEAYAIVNHANAAFDPDGKLTKAGVQISARLKNLSPTGGYSYLRDSVVANGDLRKRAFEIKKPNLSAGLYGHQRSGVRVFDFSVFRLFT